MAIVIKPFTEEFIQPVKEFNLRLSEGGRPSEFQFPEVPALNSASRSDEARIIQEFHLAVEGDQVRGGYILKRQDFSFYGKVLPAAFYQLPVSEGMVNKKYVGVGVQMLRSAHKAQPLLFGLGMGGFERPLPRMLKALKWDLTLVPFFFKVIHAKVFLREIAVLRKTRARKAIMDFASITGAGGIGLRALQSARTLGRRARRPVAVETVGTFSKWADDLWKEMHAEYSMVAVRDSQTLSAMYPRDGKKVTRLKVTGEAGVVGWVVVVSDRLRENRHFGNLKLGVIADYISLPGEEDRVIRAGAKKLEEDGVDLIICNESNRSWISALTSAGFLKGPSNVVFAASPQLAKLLQPFNAEYPKTHLNFGDGDGPFDLFR